MASNWVNAFVYHTPKPFSEALYYLYEKGVKEIVVLWNVNENKKVMYTMITSVINTEGIIDYHDHDDDVDKLIKFAEDKHENEVMMRLTLDESEQLHIEQIDEASVNAYITRLYDARIEEYYEDDDIRQIAAQEEQTGVKVEIRTKESRLIK